jgi:hypothetical protein
LSGRIITNCSKKKVYHNSFFEGFSYTWLAKLKTEDHFGDLGVDVIILKCILYSVRC